MSYPPLVGNAVALVIEPMPNRGAIVVSSYAERVMAHVQPFDGRPEDAF